MVEGSPETVLIEEEKPTWTASQVDKAIELATSPYKQAIKTILCGVFSLLTLLVIVSTLIIILEKG